MNTKTRRALLIFGAVIPIIWTGMLLRHQHVRVRKATYQAIQLENETSDPSPPSEAPRLKSKPKLAATITKPSDLEILNEKAWEQMTDEDRDRATAMAEAEAAGDSEEVHRLLKEEALREPWERETRDDQKRRLARGQTNRIVIERTDLPPQLPMFSPGDGSLPEITGPKR